MSLWRAAFAGAPPPPLAAWAASGGGAGRGSQWVAWCPWLRVRSGGLSLPSLCLSPSGCGSWRPPAAVSVEGGDAGVCVLGLGEIFGRWLRSRWWRRLLAPFPFFEAPSRLISIFFPSHTRVKTSASSGLGGSGLACAVTFLKVSSWVSWGVRWHLDAVLRRAVTSQLPISLGFTRLAPCGGP